MNSPLQYDGPMAGGVIELARHNQVPVISPLFLAGATMPLPLAGTVAMSNAEGRALVAHLSSMASSRGARCYRPAETSDPVQERNTDLYLDE